MNIRDLKYLIAVADYGHFGKAAEACFVSQPALSMQLKKLEESLGVLLIERTNKHVLVTETGKKIVQEAREIIARVDGLKEMADASNDPLAGNLRIGIIPTLGPYLLPQIIPTLSSQLPQLNLYLIEETTQLLITLLTEGKLDAALLALPIKGDFESCTLFDEEFLLAVPAGHPLATHKHVNFSDLEDSKLLLLEEGHCLRDQGLTFCHKAHASEFSDFRATSLETLRHMVAAGLSMTLMPQLASRKDDGIHYLPFSPPKPTRTIGMIWRPSSAKKILLKRIIEIIQDEINGPV